MHPVENLLFYPFHKGLGVVKHATDLRFEMLQGYIRLSKLLISKRRWIFTLDKKNSKFSSQMGQLRNYI